MSTAFILAGSASADAATNEDFARLRRCESGGNYAINTGNGYYGAYQFDLRTWRGLGYSGLPSNASPATQDEAARRLQAARGWQPWPSCSRQLGLRSGKGKAPAVPEAEPAPDAPEAAEAPEAATAAPAPESQPAPTTETATSNAVAEANNIGTAEVAPAAIEVLAIGTVLTPPPPPIQPFAIDTTGAPRADVLLWQQQMAKRGWAITADGFHGEQSARVAAAFVAVKGLVQPAGHTLTEILWNATWESPVA